MKWIFEGRVYSSLEELSGKTMSEGNKPEPVFTLEEIKNNIKQLKRFDIKPKSTPIGKCTEYKMDSNGRWVSWYDVVKYFIPENSIEIIVPKGDRLMPLSMYESINKKIDVGEGAESESEL